jgi:DNA-binding SARP family transcriptional activator
LYSLEKEKDIVMAENYLDEYLRIEPFADEMNIEYINLLLKKGERKKALDYYKYINELYKKELGTAFNSKEISYFVKEFQIY